MRLKARPKQRHFRPKQRRLTAGQKLAHDSRIAIYRVRNRCRIDISRFIWERHYQ